MVIVCISPLFVHADLTLRSSTSRALPATSVAVTSSTTSSALKLCSFTIIVAVCVSL